jgi:hypothetical protein
LRLLTLSAVLAIGPVGVSLFQTTFRATISPMARTAAELLEDALQLPQTERDWLIDNLLGEEGAMSDEAFAAWQKEVGEPEPGYDEWFRKGVEEALADSSPDTPHEQVVREVGSILQAAREAKGLKESA